MAEVNPHLARLWEVRGVLVEDRRRTADRMITSTTAVASVQTPGFIQLQNAIEAIDRAIADEKAIAEREERKLKRTVVGPEIAWGES